MSADDGLPSSQQVDQILGSSKLAQAIENDRYKHLLDHVPVAIAISRGSRSEQQVVYANKAFEILMVMMASDVEGQNWTCLDGFLNEDDQSQTLGEAIRNGEDFIGVFRPSGPVDRLVIVQAYASVIESDRGVENFRIAALVDVGGRERAQIEQFENQIRDRDMATFDLADQLELTAGATNERVFQGVGQHLVDQEARGHRDINRHRAIADLHVQGDAGHRIGLHHGLADVREILAEIDIRGGVLRRQRPVQHRQRVDPAGQPRQRHGFAFRGRARLEPYQRRDQLQIVLHAMLCASAAR